MRRKRLLTPETLSPEPVPGKELSDWRKRAGLTQRAAAQWLGVSQRTYENWEQNTRRMRHPVAVRRIMLQVDAKVRKAS